VSSFGKEVTTLIVSASAALGTMASATAIAYFVTPDAAKRQWSGVRVTPAQAGAQSLLVIFLLFVSPNLTNSIRAVIFDLDGTLIDTASEIAAALNRTLEELGLASLGQDAITAMVGRGVRTLVERALAQVEGGALIEVDPAVLRFEAHYAQTVGTDARLFDGVLPGCGAWPKAVSR
jgi:hypothetical protein